MEVIHAKIALASNTAHSRFFDFQNERWWTRGKVIDIYDTMKLDILYNRGTTIVLSI